MTANIVVDTDSLDKAAQSLGDIAADLRVGQFDSFLVDWAAIPWCPTEIATAMRAFAGLAHDTYLGAVALTSRLSMHVASAAANYRLKDIAAAQQLGQPLAGFAPPPAGR